MLELVGVGKTYLRGDVPFAAVDDVSLKIETGGFVSIVGRSGIGKSTLLNLIAGLLKPDRGSISFMGKDIAQLDDRTMSAIRNARIGYIPQGASLLPNFTVTDNIRLPWFLSGRREADATGRARYLLGEVGLSHLSDAYPAQLSGGEMRRVAIARALINTPDLVVADEPTSDLDAVSLAHVTQMLLNIHRRGTALLMVTHELETVAYSDRVALMRYGRLLELEKADIARPSLLRLLSE